MPDRTPLTTDVGILGGGIAGLTTATALDAAGLPATVFEQATQMDTVGVGIQLSPNATRVLAGLGFAEALDEVASRPRAITVRRWDGDVAAEMPLGRECAHRFGAPYYTLHRADLQRLLLAAIPDSRIRLGHQCVRMNPSAESVTAIFADGTRHDLAVLLGADGLHSVARRHLAADEAVFSGLAAYRGLVDADLVPEFRDDPRIRAWFGPGQHCVCYPVSRGRFLSFTAMAPANPDSQGCSLTSAYQGWDPVLVTMLDNADLIGRWELYDREPLGRWSTATTTLLGDAAHPMLPFRAQGANQAIEDAEVLTACLTEHTDPPTALRRYEELRRPRASQVQMESRSSAQSFHQADAAGQTRPRTPTSWSLASQDWLFGYRPELAVTADTVTA